MRSVEWAALRQEQLRVNWNRCRNAQAPARIDPLE